MWHPESVSLFIIYYYQVREWVAAGVLNLSTLRPGRTSFVRFSPLAADADHFAAAASPVLRGLPAGQRD